MPRQPGRVGLIEYPDPIVTDQQVVTVVIDVAREAAVGGVVAGQVGQGIDIGQFVDRHDLEGALDRLRLRVGVQRPQNALTDPAVAVNGDIKTHRWNLIPDHRAGGGLEPPP